MFMKVKVRIFAKKCQGVPYEKGRKITKNATCVYKGELESTRCENEGFSTKTAREYPTKKSRQSRKSNVCP